MKRIAVGFRNFLEGLWRDRGRLVGALGGAVLLWFLLSGEVQDDVKFELPVRVVQESDAGAPVDGITIRVPATLAVEDFDPSVVEVTLRGTREDIGRLGESLSGSYTISRNLLDNQDRREYSIDATRDVAYAKLKSIPLQFAERVPISLKVTRRERFDVPLTKDNLIFQPPSLAEGYVVEFDPGVAPISGPADQIQKIRVDPKRLKLGITVTKANIDTFVGDAGGRAPGAGAYLLESDASVGDRRTLLRLNDNRSITVRMRLERLMRDVVIENVHIDPLIPPDVMRAGMDPVHPVSLLPELATVKLKVPQEYFASGHDETELRFAISTFVNLRDMEPTVDAAKLAVRYSWVDAPPGASITIEPAQTDVAWRPAH